jgi:calcineurin-like phosphoesterase family protein
MAIFFTSDLHLGHRNIIRYCNRPFKNVNEMDDILISNWNSIVREEDTVYHLGDFAFKDADMYLKELNGNILFVRGNHDRPIECVIGKNALPDVRNIKLNGQDITLCHYSLRVWNKSHFNSWHLFGHSHGTIVGYGKSFDVGVDAQDYKPISFEWVQRVMKTRPNNMNWVENLPGFSVEEYEKEYEKNNGKPVDRDNL